MIAFIDEYRDRFSVEFICKTLNEQRQGGFITSRGYRNAKYGTPSARSIRDRELVAKVLQIHGENYGVYGVRKMWHALSRCGLAVGRERTARLMRLAGVSGKGKGRSLITTRKARREDTRPDLVHREFHAAGPNRLWVADVLSQDIVPTMSWDFSLFWRGYVSRHRSTRDSRCCRRGWTLLPLSGIRRNHVTRKCALLRHQVRQALL